MPMKPRLAVFKFASCDGCQLQVLDAQQTLMAIAERVEICHFPEARSQSLAGPYDIGLVEGSISTAGDLARVLEIRQACRFLVTIGACATAGGIQALRNWFQGDEAVGSGRASQAHASPATASLVYASPAYVESLTESTPISDHVPVDFELRGCPIDAGQFRELITAVLIGRRPRVPRHSVCVECKERGTVCVAVAQGIACLGPATQAGCGAICPAHGRECFGCYGPDEQPNLVSLTGFYERRGTPRPHLARLVRSFTAWAPDFRRESERLDHGVGGDTP